MRGRVKRRGSA
jgi:hypothetical protein